MTTAALTRCVCFISRINELSICADNSNVSMATFSSNSSVYSAKFSGWRNRNITGVSELGERTATRLEIKGDRTH